MHKPFILITVPIISLCATFIFLYLYVPHPKISSFVAITKVPNFVHDAPVSVAISPPVQLNIETINVNAPISPVGLTPLGNMDISENPTELAWYQLGPKPGEEGSAVIAGHYGWKNGVPSVFNDLHTLVKGDTVSVDASDGSTKVFIVSRVATYAPDQDATYIFKSDDGLAHLNLITCQGAWNNSQRTYSERFVVFTDYVK